MNCNKLQKKKHKPKYHNNNLNVDVITNQETQIQINKIKNIQHDKNSFYVNYT